MAYITTRVEPSTSSRCRFSDRVNPSANPTEPHSILSSSLRRVRNGRESLSPTAGLILQFSIPDEESISEPLELHIMPTTVSCSMLKLLLVSVLGLVSVSVSAQCTDIHIVFARGSIEPQGLGICGRPLVSGITSALSGKTVSSHAVVYDALATQTSAGPGATSMTRHIVKYAAQCPNAVFVIGGYSQGGTVTDIAIGIETVLGTGETIPVELAPRIKAVVVFGNPLHLTGQTIAQASPTYGAKAIEYCSDGDPICATGANFFTHLTYAADGSVAKAARRAAQMVLGGSGGDSDGLANNSDSGTKPNDALSVLSGLSVIPSLLSGKDLPALSFGNLRSSE
jgi:cutinase